MSERTKYKTRQRETLIRYLKAAPEGHVTAFDVCDYLRGQGESIGQSTVYRQLESLVDEGVVNKYTVDPNTPACFEYVGVESHEGAPVCFHCKCVNCGKLIHLHCDEMQEIRTHLLREHGFLMNSMRTGFYGLCEECLKAQTEGAK